MSNVLEVNGLTKRYPNYALENLSFYVKENSIVGFIGANGAGKTTTIKLLLGLIKGNSGTIKFFDNENLKENQIKNRIGVVLDSECFYKDLSMNDMKKIIAPAYSEWNESTYKEYLQRFELNPKQKISSLSTGMRVKFSLALAISHNAQLLIMDEPSSGLDPVIRNQLDKILMEYVSKGKNSVFFSTHITSDLDRIADTILCIDHGKRQFFEQKDELVKKYMYFKGSKNDLSEADIKKLPLYVENGDTFYGISESKNDIYKKDCFQYRAPVIEEIMMCYVKEKMKYE